MNDRGMQGARPDGPIAEGTVGWDDDGGNAIDLGDTPNDGNSLVRVTLFRGRDATTKLQQGVAGGQKILCRLGTSVLRIPVYGAKVIVAIPEPWGTMPGGPVIIETVDPAAWKRFGNAKPGDVYIPAGSGQGVLAIKATGGMAFKTTADNTGQTAGMFLSFGPGASAFTVSAPFGSIEIHKLKGVVLKSAWGAALKLFGALGTGGALPSIAKLTGGTVKIDSSQILQGPDLPGTKFVPTTAAMDPGGPPLLAALLAALSPFVAAVQACITPLGGNPTMTGVSPEQIAQLTVAIEVLTSAIATTGGVLTTTSVKVAAPVP